MAPAGAGRGLPPPRRARSTPSSRRILRATPPAEEITQEVFFDLWNHPEKFDAQRGTLRSFLLARTHGKSVDFVRSETSRRRREEQDLPGDRHRRLRHRSRGVGHGRGRAGQGGAGGPPDELRQPIELAYFGGHTYREVAEMLGARRDREEPQNADLFLTARSPPPRRPGRRRRGMTVVFTCTATANGLSWAASSRLKKAAPNLKVDISRAGLRSAFRRLSSRIAPAPRIAPDAGSGTVVKLLEPSSVTLPLLR